MLAVAAHPDDEEQVASAAVVGVSTVEFLDHPDGTIEPALPLRRDLAVAIRRHRPDTLLLFDHRETWGPGRLNSPDHRHLGQAALDAIGDAGNRWIFPRRGGGLAPHAGDRTPGLRITGRDSRGGRHRVGGPGRRVAR